MKILKILSIIFVALALCAFATAADRNSALRITQGPQVEGVGDSWAVIAWTTNTGGSSVVRYGVEPRNLNLTAQAPYADNDRTREQNHRVRIQGLNPGSTYYFMVVSAQGEGTGTRATSEVGRFLTQGGRREESHEAVRITDGPRVEGVGRDWAVIAWTTNTGGSSIVRYGMEPGHFRQMAEAPYADNDNTREQNHRVRLTNLQPDTRYYFIVASGQGEGTGTRTHSPVGEFTTKRR
jgi:phosphodiesterase/alkaline phosphatase D-like protein